MGTSSVFLERKYYKIVFPSKFNFLTIFWNTQLKNLKNRQNVPEKKFQRKNTPAVNPIEILQAVDESLVIAVNFLVDDFSNFFSQLIGNNYS